MAGVGDSCGAQLRKPQKTLFDDMILDEDRLKEKDDSSVKQAAELFLAREYNLPYYFGSERIVPCFAEH